MNIEKMGATKAWFAFMKEIGRALRWTLVPYLVLFTFRISIPLVMAFISKYIIDVLLGDFSTAGQITTFGIAFFIWSLAMYQVYVWFEYVRYYAIEEAVYSYFHRRLVSKVASLDMAQLEDHKVQSLIQRAEDGTFWMSRKVVDSSDTILRGMLTVIGSVAIFLSFNPLWIIATIVMGTINGVGQFLETRKIYRYDLSQEEENKRIWMLRYDLLQKEKLFELRIFSGVQYVYKKFADTIEKLRIGKLKLGRRFSGMYSLLGLLKAMIEVGFVVSVVMQAKHGIISVGSVVMLISVFERVTGVMEDMGNGFGRLGGLTPRVVEFSKLMAIKTQLQDGGISVSASVAPEIMFDNVWFKYPGSKPWVIKNLTLAVKPGEKIAIVGKNGAGKTTFLKLLMRVYDPDKGVIKVNGVDLRKTKLATWHDTIGLMLQDFGTYSSLTVAENIALSDITRVDERGAIVHAAKEADADEFVQELEKKYDTVLSRKFKQGTELSLGQWQKLAIARMFFENGKILVLDEPTSSVDPISEEKIFNMIYEEVKGKTVIIVSHRFTTVRGADRIIVIEAGQVMEQGTHEELIKNDGFYAKAYNSQMNRLKYGWTGTIDNRG